MITLSRTPRHVMEARWKAYRERLREEIGPIKPPPRPMNVHAVLSLGTMTYFQFRGRAYGVPPLPWKEGEKLLDIWLQLKSYGTEIPEAEVAVYFECMARLAKVLWRNTRPPKPILRFLKRVRFLSNPYLSANEQELAEAAVFFLGLRTKSTDSFKPEPAPLPT